VVSCNKASRLTVKFGILGRYSTAFFVHPSPDVIINPVAGEGEKVKYESIKAGEWRRQMTERNYSVAMKA
jgi:hypothetical protein